MLRRLSIITAFLSAILLLGFEAHAQDGKLAGTVLNPSGEPAAFAQVLVFQGDLFRYGGQTDEEGTFSIQPIQAGTYRVEARFLGNKKAIEGVTINPNQTRNLTLSFDEEAVAQLDVVEIFEERAFEGNDPIVGTTVSNEQIVNNAVRDISTMAALSPGVYQSDQGSEGLVIRGQRSSGNVYYIDGVKVRGQTALPQSSIQQLQVILGGTPAEFGDFTGGVISITTANPASSFSGNLELVTSEYLDAYGRNLAGFAVTGPLITKTQNKGTENEYKTSLLGFFLNGELDYNRDSDPAALGVYQLDDAVLTDLQQTPVQISEDGQSFRSRANYITGEQIQSIKAKTNNESLRARALVRFDFQPANSVLIKAGGNVEYIKTDQWGIGNMLFAPDNKSEFEGAYYRAFLRFQQSFSGGNSAVRNLFYSIQADYSLYQRRFQHSVHRENFFDYGYVGKFDFDVVPFYGYFNSPDEVSSSPYWRTVGYGFDNLSFDGTDTRNQILANHNQVMFDYAAANGGPNLSNFNEFAFRQGILNGGGAPGIYSIYSGLGAETGGYNKFDFEQYRVTGQATAEINGHNLKAGFEFEQRVERSYGITARSLWGWMRQYSNFHLLNLEDNPDNFQYITVDGEFQDTVIVPRRYEEGDQRAFDIALRQKLGLPIDGTDWVNVDAYGPETYSLDMFTADELLADGLGPIAYYGYDYLGNKQPRVGAGAFLTDEVNRPQDAFAPTYISAFLQDRFEFEDIVFNIGVRVDRFDANQLVLKDNYSLYSTYTAAEVAAGSIGVPNFTLPAGVGGDYVPYVNDPNNPTEVVGYRSGEIWYDANGAPVSSNVIAGLSGGTVKPAVKNGEVSLESFEDYAPQTVIMPRVSFSFPITDQASFFAHYDVLSQRPGQLSQTSSSLLAGRISDYVFLENRPTSTVLNPNLRPEITVDYEAGFKQRIGLNMAMTISAYYRELRNQVRFRRFVNAYPFSYDTYDNLDFGTVKGFSFSFNMRRTNNIALQAGYTLQFADATGSDFSSARAVVNFLEGAGVLRVPLPINSDQRHRFTGNLDYRFSGPTPQNWGPSMKIGEKTIYPLRDMGLNLTGYIGSGTPYTKNAVVVPAVQGGVNIVNQTEGTPNGVRQPWQFRLDGRIDKTFMLGGKSKKDEMGGEFLSRAYGLNLYLNVLNVLDTRNVINVYRYTGLPDDDGFLASATGQQTVIRQIDPQAFIDQYTLRVANPNNYSLPRRIQLGAMFNF